MLTTAITTVLSVFVGGLITWLVSRRYYQKASEDLEAEAGRLRAQSNLVLRALREFSVTGDVEYNANPETGEPEGLSIKRTATSHLGISDDANVEVRRDEPENPPEHGNR